MATSPTLLVSLDIQTPERRGALTLMQASTPVILVQILQRGQVFRPGSAWTATLKFASTLSPAGWTTVTNASVDVTNGIFRFEFSTAQANATGLKHCLVHVLDDASGVFFSGRIDLTFIASNANTGAGNLPVGETVDWNGTSYANTAAAGPYRPGSNVTFGANADGSVNVNATTGVVSDGDKGDIVVSGSGAAWAIKNAAVSLAKQAALPANTMPGNNTGGSATPVALTAAQVRAFVGLGDAVWWDSYAMDFVRIGYVGTDDYRHPSKPVSGICAKSALSTLQTATLRFAARQAPYGFSSYKTSGALEIWYTSDNNNSANVKITGISVTGSNNMVDWSAVYSDSTARTPATAHEITLVSIDAASFSSASVYRFYAVEVYLSVRNEFCLVVLNVAVRGQ